MFFEVISKLNVDLLNPTLKYAAVIALYQPANQALASFGANGKYQGIGAIAIQYSDELIICACLFLLFVSSIVGVFYKTPVYGGLPLPIWLKAPICIMFGFCAFLFCLHTDKALTLLTPIWVGGMSFIAPAIIHLVHALLVKHFGMKFGVDEAALRELQRNGSTES